MIKASFVGGDELVVSLRHVSDAIGVAAERGIGRAVLFMQSEVMRNRLSGQVLRVRTGTLRRSIDQSTSREGNLFIGQVGTNVWYGVAHEYGFSGTVSVKAHIRNSKKAFGLSMKDPRPTYVKPHSRRVQMTERSFLRSALRDHVDTVETMIIDEINKVIT